ncbi:MAG: hypothetical protein JWO23_2338 [Solirubrobacterales bacterium]|jgi:hypothetical protein|nr:hypothetical protein [Solirubrobacterales bacterium]MCW3025438.1 hypothetical protein [Solirubrobacterales bacterium]
MTAVAIVAVSSDVSRADAKPGEGLTPPARRPMKATIGASRYRTMSPLSHGSGLIALERQPVSARPPSYADRWARRSYVRRTEV